MKHKQYALGVLVDGFAMGWESVSSEDEALNPNTHNKLGGMMITIIAHFSKGIADPFPTLLQGIAGEGCVFTNSQIGEGGVIVVSFDTDDQGLVRRAFEKHLVENDLSALALHRVGDSQFFYSKTQSHIF